MCKLKIKKTDFGFKLCLEGEIEVKKDKIKSYEQYYKEEEEKQIKEQIYKYLETIVPSFINYDFPSPYSFNKDCGRKETLEKLASFLAEDK